MALPPNVMSRKCSSRLYMSHLASKWALLIINALDDQPRRNGELVRIVDGISQKMLTQTLRQLEDINVVSRQDLQTIPPHVIYQLTPLGRSLCSEVRSFIRWVEAHMPELNA